LGQQLLALFVLSSYFRRALFFWQRCWLYV
jgi:hypothetical protein